LLAGHNTTLIVVEAANGEVFGGLATDRWQVSSKYYGSGNSFLFHFGESSQSPVCSLLLPSLPSPPVRQ
jgi:hypothetical protein